MYIRLSKLNRRSVIAGEGLLSEISRSIGKCGIGNTWKAAKPGMNRGKSDHKGLYAVCMQSVFTGKNEWWMDVDDEQYRKPLNISISQFCHDFIRLYSVATLSFCNNLCCPSSTSEKIKA